VNSIKIIVNGKVYKTCYYTRKCEMTINTSTFTPGTHTFTFTAVDRKGLTNSKSVTVTKP
jgi:hypothetical protein